MLVIGSVALKMNRVETTVNDIDVIGTYDELEELIRGFNPVSYFPTSNGRKYKLIFKEPFINEEGFEKTYRMEFEVAWSGTTAKELLDIVGFYRMTVSNKSSIFIILETALGWGFANLDVLYALKMSHRYLKNSPHFLKTRNDIMRIRNIIGSVDIRTDLQEWFKRREKETYNYGHPKLNQSKKDFFSNDGVNYIYDHDSLHQAMATITRVRMIEPGYGFEYKIDDKNDTYGAIFGEGVKPAYMFYQQTGSQVQTSATLFASLPEFVKLRGVMEEAQILALERAVIPNGMDPDEAFEIALKKICTSITSGWFREFAWENYDGVMSIYNMSGRDYVKRFEKALKAGIVKRYQEA